MTDNQKARRNVWNLEEVKIGRKLYAETLKNIKEKGVDFSRISINLVKEVILPK